VVDELINCYNVLVPIRFAVVHFGIYQAQPPISAPEALSLASHRSSTWEEIPQQKTIQNAQTIHEPARSARFFGYDLIQLRWSDDFLDSIKKLPS